MKKVLLIALFVVCAPVFAQERNVHLTVWASQVDMQGETDFADGFEFEHDEGNALGLSVNYGVHRLISIEGSVFAIRSDAGLEFENAEFGLGSFDLVPFSLGAQLHPLGDSRFDPYVGAGATYIVADDLSSEDLATLGLGRIELENEFTYYLNAGIGVRLGGGFGIAIDARQFQYEPVSRSTATGVEQDLDLTPRLLSVGLRFKF